MKYAKELHQTIQRLPPSLQEASLSYKVWKKRCKEITLQDAMVLLKTECDQVESIFTENYTEWLTPHKMSFLSMCFHHRQGTLNVDPKQLLLYAEINAKTMYKICKRLGKMTHDPTAMNWLTSLRTSHTFGFLGGHHTTHLQFCKQYCATKVIECPICMEEVWPQFMLIYGCGHYACTRCMIRYAKAPKNALWYHALANARRKICPYCRYDNALMGVTTIVPKCCV